MNLLTAEEIQGLLLCAECHDEWSEADGTLCKYCRAHHDDRVSALLRPNPFHEAVREHEEYQAKATRALQAHEQEARAVGGLRDQARNRHERRLADARGKALTKKINRTLKRYK